MIVTSCSVVEILIKRHLALVETGVLAFWNWARTSSLSSSGDVSSRVRFSPLFDTFDVCVLCFLHSRSFLPQAF